MNVSILQNGAQEKQFGSTSTKYYPCAIHDGEDDLDSLADIVASQSTISKAECYGVIMALTKTIGESLANRRI
ncbi:HU family DNA-binding protein [Flavobacterium soyangense]|uniref:HU domain-containing protein n=1 Tax=Flavobacterium soyangense TaxID=2023265 RepID=A0A930XVQ6_9FLAO|nr:hypothetical protein [Flavobacterium soyangense]MBF2708556.1 hypothetical protein [Flavobacterium soyangense]